jgi:hypothetical protein
VSEAEIKAAYAAGQAGISAGYAAASASSLIQMNLPMHLSRSWLINLLSQRYDAGGATQLAIAQSALQPLDNQVCTSFATSATSYQIQGAFVIVEYGNAGVLETAFVDYPFGGSSFVVNAGQVKVSCPTPRALLPNTAPPRYGAYISETFVRDSSPSNPPTLTIVSTLQPAVGVVVHYPVPPRAIGYRLFNGNIGSPVGVSFTVNEEAFVGGFQVSFTTDSNVDSLNGNAGAISLYGAQQVTVGNNESFRPLHPAATSIGIANNSATVAANIVVQWALDLG